MDITFTNLLHSFATNNFKNSTPLKNYSSYAVSLPRLDQDVFVKSVNKVSFKGTSENDDNLTISDALITAGVVGAPLLLTIASANYMAKHQNPKELFTQDGYYIGNADDSVTETNKILIDKTTGEINFKGTDLHIDPVNYDYVDPENGIYRNYDGSADINLSENKFIDKNLGIIVDPENQISAFRNANGLYEYHDLPNFGSGYPTNPNAESMPPANWTSVDEQTRQEFIEKYGQTPEEFFHNDPDLMHTHAGSWLINHNDYRNTMQKIQDFFTGKNDIAYDAWGRRLFEYKNPDGSTTTYAMNEDTMKFAQEHNLTDEQISKIVEFADQVRLQEYFTENHPELMIEKSILYTLGFEEHTENATDNINIETDGDFTDKVAMPDDYPEDSVLENLLKIFIHSN